MDRGQSGEPGGLGMTLDDLYKVVMLTAAWIITDEFVGLVGAFVMGISILVIITYIMAKNVKNLIDLNDNSTNFSEGSR
jgi:hypothetical protein